MKNTEADKKNIIRKNIVVNNEIYDHITDQDINWSTIRVYKNRGKIKPEDYLILPAGIWLKRGWEVIQKKSGRKKKIENQ